MGEARPGFVFSLAVPYRDTTAKRAIQVSQSPAGQRLLDRSAPATRPVVIPAVHGVLGCCCRGSRWTDSLGRLPPSAKVEVPNAEIRPMRNAHGGLEGRQELLIDVVENPWHSGFGAREILK
jgi:hypothetical protein